MGYAGKSDGGLCVNGWSDFLFRWALKRLTYDFTLTEGTRFPVSLFICRNGSCICPLGIIEWWLVPERIFS